MPIARRELLTRSWKFGLGLVGLAGAWTTWDLFRPRGRGFSGPVRTVPVDTVPEDGILEVPAIKGYLTKVDGEVVALNWVCTHLGCRVPWCDSSSQFECPCHGTQFNRAGEHRSGPAPRGLDRYAVTVTPDGIVEVDVAALEPGPAPGTQTLDEPPTGPSCTDAGGH